MKDKKSNIDCDKEREAVQIALGQLTPETEYQKAIAKEIKEIAEKGGIVEIPSN